MEIVKKYASKISYWVSEPDNGAAEALNKGFAKATGDWYFYLNSDDLLLPGAISRAVGFLQKNPGFDVYFGHGFLLDQASGKKRPLYSDRWDLYGYYKGKVVIIQQSTFIRPAAFHTAGGFNLENETCWDGELLVDISLLGSSFYRMNDFFGVFRLHSQSISGSQQRKRAHQLNRRRINQKIESGLSIEHKKPSFFFQLSKWINDPIVSIGRVKSKLYQLQHMR